MKYDVFISYRREGGDKYARTIQQALKNQYRVFLDYDELKDGVFDQRIIDAISESPVFLLILSKGALDRCVNENDWVRQEILHAVKCGCHIVPVTIDDTFDGLPASLPEELRCAVGQHQFSELQMKTLFESSMELLVKNRIAPYVQREDAATGTEIHIDVDADCDMFRFNKFVRHLKAGEDNVIHLKPGKYKLEFVSTQIPEIKDSRVYYLNPDMSCDFIEVALKEEVEEKRKAAEEAKRKAAAEEARRKAAEEAKRRAAEEAKRKAAEEDAKRKAEEEVKKQAAEFNRLGDDYYYGRNGKTQDYTEAVKWYRKAAEQGNADAQCNLGWMYSTGRGVTQSDEEAVKWYRKAAEQGDATAQNNLGLKYANGRGVTQSDEEAVKWYRKAAEQGNADAQCKIGRAHV